MENEKNEKEIIIQENDFHIAELKEELESLNFYQKEYARMEIKCTQLEQKSEKISEFESNIETLQSNLDEKDHLINHMKIKYQELESQSVEKSRFINLENKLDDLHLEIDKLTSINQ